MSDLLASASATENNLDGSKSTTAATPSPRSGEEEEEMAFGPTPAYSLSKAAANAAVRTWAPRLLTRTATAGAAGTSEKSSTAGGGVRGVRLVAVCPGDVLTRMTSKVGTAAILPPTSSYFLYEHPSCLPRVDFSSLVGGGGLAMLISLVGCIPGMNT